MRSRRACRLLLGLCVVSTTAVHAQTAASTVSAAVDTFNTSLASATRRMDNAATLALWEADGVSLLPGTAPLVGKPALARFFDAVMGQFPGARMVSFDLQCHGVEGSASWASEWCEEHQVVGFPDGRPDFDGRGRMLLVLHRGADNLWRIAREMWIEAEAPDSSRR